MVKYKLKNWININYINWHCLSMNPNAIAVLRTELLKENLDKIKSLPVDAKNILFSFGKGIVYTDQILVINANGEATNWTPSNADLFATDWYVVE